MNRLRRTTQLLLLTAALLLAPAARLRAQAPASPDQAAILNVLQTQAADWNRGDLDRFATGYKDSPDILFVGTSIARGYRAMLARYHRNYPTPAAMGHLTFSNLEAHPLDAHFALCTGSFHLQRTQAGGGDRSGIFSLVFEKTPAGWKIILDHTS